MATRDLFETRRTNAQGDTEWLPSILVQGAMDGDCVILDGLHRLPHDNIAALSRLLLDGCVDLPSGKRVYANENFRVVALAEPPSSKNPWLRSDAYPLFSFTELSSSSNVSDIVRGVISLFFFTLTQSTHSYHLPIIYPCHFLAIIPLECYEKQVQILDTLHPSLPASWSENISHLSDLLQNSENLPNLTLRQMLRLARSAETKKAEYDFRAEIHEALLLQFAPLESRRELDDILDNVGVESSSKMESSNLNNSLVLESNDDVLHVGSASHPISKPTYPHLIPNPVFFHNDMQNRVMERMLLFLNSGEKHFLLIGNQGT